MNNVDWSAMLTDAQLEHAKYLQKTEGESPRFVDLLINEVLISMPCPTSVDRKFEAGFLHEYADYHPSALGRLLAEHLKRK